MDKDTIISKISGKIAEQIFNESEQRIGKNKSAVQITYNGNVVSVSNRATSRGKTLWKRISDAKSALNKHIPDLYRLTSSYYSKRYMDFISEEDRIFLTQIYAGDYNERIKFEKDFRNAIYDKFEYLEFNPQEIRAIHDLLIENEELKKENERLTRLLPKIIV